MAQGRQPFRRSFYRTMPSRSVANFFKVYRPLLDSWTLFDNSTTRPSLIAEEKDGKLTLVDATLFAKISKTVED